MACVVEGLARNGTNGLRASGDADSAECQIRVNIWSGFAERREIATRLAGRGSNGSENRSAQRRKVKKRGDDRETLYRIDITGTRRRTTVGCQSL